MANKYVSNMKRQSTRKQNKAIEGCLTGLFLLVFQLLIFLIKLPFKLFKKDESINKEKE